MKTLILSIFLLNYIHADSVMEQIKTVFKAGDYKKTVQMLQNECDDGNTKGCVILGHLYQEGSNVEQNKGKAIKYYQMACEGGVKEACRLIQQLNNEKYCVIDGKCSHCGSSHLSRYLYGLIVMDKELKEKESKGEIVLGGCVVGDDSPQFRCMNCGVDLIKKNVQVKKKAKNE